MKSFIKILFLSTLFLLISCIGDSKDDALIAIILTEVYFMEREFGREECDNFYYNNEIVKRLKEIDETVTDEILQEAFKLRKEKSNDYNR